MDIKFFLSFFCLLFVSVIVFLIYQKNKKVPYTVLLVIAGMVVGLLANFPPLDFISKFSLTPEILFFVFLPVLIFESAYNMNIRRLVESITPIALLSFVGLVLSTGAIALLLSFVSGLMGIPIPWQASLLFGSIISSTDPVAVLALFKEYGAPRKLSLIFEGESLFNDGTAVALFLAILAMITSGNFGTDAVFEGVASFVSMVVGGILVGLLFGLFFSYLLRFAKGNESVSLILMLVMAHTTFIISEFLNQHLVLGGFHFHISPIISTTIASIIMGNFGRSKISPRDEEFIEKFWGNVTFLINSIVFLLVGMFFTSTEFPIGEIWPVVLLAMVVVAVARAFSVYPVIFASNYLSRSKVPLAWAHLLSWGSLRGALAVIVVLLIPENLSFANWPLTASPKELILAMTVGCILGTLVGKATTMNWLMKKLSINKLDSVDEDRKSLSLAHSKAYMLEKLESMFHKGYIIENSYEQIKKKIDLVNIGNSFETKSLERILHIYALGIEISHLKNIYSREEVSEKVYRYIGNKINIQIEKIEDGEPIETLDFSLAHDKKDSPVIFLEKILSFFFPKTKIFSEPKEKYHYYRAQAIVARKAVKELADLKGFSSDMKDVLSRVSGHYEKMRDASLVKMLDVIKKEGLVLEELETKLSLKSLSENMEKNLRDLKHKELLGAHVYAQVEGIANQLKD